MSDLKVGSPAAIGAPPSGPSVNGAPALAASDPGTIAATARRANPEPQAPIQRAAPVVQTAALDAGEPPVDIDRVATIRSAIASGHYPLVPAQIGDAMIAAGILLRVGEA